MCSQLMVTFDRKRLRSGVTILWIYRLLAVIMAPHAHWVLPSIGTGQRDDEYNKLDPVFRSPGSIGCQRGNRSLVL